MFPPLVLLVGVGLGVLWGGITAAQEPQAARQAIAHAFAGTHQFSYLFVENGVPYFDHPAHVQVVETEEDPEQQTTQIAFYNQTGDGKRLHFRYVLQGHASHITLQEFDARGTHRFDCVGTYQPETRLLQCTALNAPKPARDLDTPLMRQLGLFKRPTAWKAYAFLHRHNLFRLYEWGLVHIQENIKVDEAGQVVARETGVITALRLPSVSALSGQ